MTADAYAGLRILDFTQGIAGPMATALISDFGAEVIKIEPPTGDRARRQPGYHYWNHNKLRVTLDTAATHGATRALSLIETADVAVFDPPPRAMGGSPCAYDRLADRFPGLLHAWMPPYGTTAALSELPSDDGLLSALTGTAAMQYSYEDRPTWIITPQIAYGQAAIAAVSIAAALYERRRSGLGQSVVVSGLHGFSAVQTPGASRAEGISSIEGRGSRGGAPHYQLYRCADGRWFFLATLNTRFFLRALVAADLLDLMTMPGVEGDFANLFASPQRERAIERLDARFAERPRDAWLRILRAADVPCAPVGRREAWFAGDAVAANHMRVALPHATLGTVAVPGAPVKLSATPGAVRHLPRDITIEDLPPHTPALAAQQWRSNGGPLAGVRILDLGNAIAGPFGPTILASFGADVIKVEPPNGDFWRDYGVQFVATNRGKRDVVLDLKTARGQDAFVSLTRTADIVCDNFRPDVRARIGIDYRSLRHINPRIITCSVTGFGDWAAGAAQPAFDPVLQADSGIMEAQGGGDEPVFHHTAVTDNATAMISVFGALVALYAREGTGEGQEVTTSLTNQSVLFQSSELVDYVGRPAALRGALDCIGVSALRRFFECADGWLALACTTPAHVEALFATLGLSAILDHTTPEALLAAPLGSPLTAHIAGRLRLRPRARALTDLDEVGVPAAPAITAGEIFPDPYLAANRVLEQYSDPVFGRITGVRTYAEFSRTPAVFARPAPTLGQHTEEVLRELGLQPLADG